MAAILDSLSVLMGWSPLSAKRSAPIVSVGGLRWHGVILWAWWIGMTNAYLVAFRGLLFGCLRAARSGHRHGRPDQSAERPYTVHGKVVGASG